MDGPGQHLYLIQMGHTGAVKVGRSGDPKERLRQLQTGCPYPLRLILVLEDKGWLEKSIHKRLGQARGGGRTGGGEEWFDYEALPELPQWIYDRLDLAEVDWWWTESGGCPPNKSPSSESPEPPPE